MSEKQEITSISDNIYQKGKLGWPKLILLFILIFSITIISNLSIEDKIIKITESTINSINDCPINYSKISFSWFMPKLILVNPEVSPRCFGRSGGKSLKLKQLPVSLQFPSVYPPGLKFKLALDAKQLNTSINIYPTFAFGKQIIRITDTSIDGRFISELLGNNYLRGKIDIESVVELVNNAPTDGDILIQSKNLTVPGQNISGINLPELSINNFELKGTLEKGKFTIKSIIIGDQNSPIIANFTGIIRLNKYNVTKSKINLSGEIKFSNELLKSFPILNMFIAGKENRGGFYKLELDGQLTSPRPKFL